MRWHKLRENVPGMLLASRLGRMVVFVVSAVTLGAGCLNLGGRTTHVHDNPETNGRIAALEERVSSLEQAFTRGVTSGQVIEEMPR